MKLICDEIRLEGLMKCLKGRIGRLPWAKQSGIVAEAENQIATLSVSGGRITHGVPQADDIHSVFEAGVSLWGLLYPAAIQAIDFDVRGVGELKKYVSRFTRFEDFIYTAEERYRDHILHSVWVYALGEWMAEKFIACEADPIYVPFMCEETRKGPKGQVTGWQEMDSINRSLFKNAGPSLDGTSVPNPPSGWYDGLRGLYLRHDAMWAVAALLHDIGYPLARLMKIEDEIRKTLQAYGPFYPSELEVQWSPIQTQSVSRFIDFSSEYLSCESPCSELLSGDPAKQMRIESEPFVTSIVSKSIEDRDHGVLGAYLLYRLTRSFKRLYNSRTLEPNDQWWFTMFLAKGSILSAITGHTIPVYRYDMFPQFGAFLFLVDELEDGLRLYKIPGERRYRVRPFSTYFGITRARIGLGEALVLGISEKDRSQSDTNEPAARASARKAFVHRFGKIFHLFNSERVSQRTPVVVHFEYEGVGAKYAAEAKFLQRDVGIYLEDRSSPSEEFSGREGIEKFFERDDLLLGQPWEPETGPSVEIECR